mmetsp:Transcript_30727/g.80424  ORF Transcript_30727/g.80424 Transcript_30727/m.80424 type:complete len:236 (-) Transcript_30727:402-1109(-)
MLIRSELNEAKLRPRAVACLAASSVAPAEVRKVSVGSDEPSRSRQRANNRSSSVSSIGNAVHVPSLTACWKSPSAPVSGRPINLACASRIRCTICCCRSRSSSMSALFCRCIRRLSRRESSREASARAVSLSWARSASSCCRSRRWYELRKALSALCSASSSSERRLSCELRFRGAARPSIVVRPMPEGCREIAMSTASRYSVAVSTDPVLRTSSAFAITLALARLTVLSCAGAD